MNNISGNEKKKLLLIDDSNDTLDLLEIFLYKKFDTFTAQNGFDALNIAQQEIPDCILTDIMMPVMDGVKFLNNLKKNEDIAHIPVIAVTSFIKKMSTKSLLNIGFTGVIIKPLARDKVLDTIKKVMESHPNNGK